MLSLANYWLCTISLVAISIPVKAILYHSTVSPYKLLQLPLLDSINSNIFQSTDFGHSIDSVGTLDRFPSLTSSPFFPSQLSSSVFLTNGFKPLTTVKSPSDLLLDDLSSLQSYLHNGRVLKQYFVAEDNVDDLNTHNSLEAYVPRFVPFIPSKFNFVSASKAPNLGFPTVTNPTVSPKPATVSIPFINPRFTQPSVAITKLHPQFALRPIQIGSGGLGVLKLPNGQVYLGSGSYSYTNDEQKANEINDVRNRQSPGPGPLTFGKTP